MNDWFVKIAVIILVILMGLSIYRGITVFLEIKNKKRKRNKFDSLATVIIGLTVLVMGFIEPDNLNAACIKLIIAFCVLYYIPDLFFPRVSD